MPDSYNKEALNSALGRPKYYINTPGLPEGEFYSWFPTAGNSMTDGSPDSIPPGSLVLGRLLHLCGVKDIPLHRPIVVIIDDEGEQFCLLKSACRTSSPEADEAAQMLCLRSYNPAPSCDDFWLPFSCIRFVFVVERVRLPNGEEFVPRPKEAARRGSGPETGPEL